MNLSHSGDHSFSALGAVAVALLFAAASGCTTAPKYQPAPVEAASPSYKYLIGPGDALNVIVWRNPDLSSSVLVRPDGRITVPLVEDLTAIGKDPTTLSRDVERALQEYIRDPVVTIMVAGFVGPYEEQVRVVGEATRPQALSYRQKMTVLDVMIAVGGITDFADGNGASILRTSEGKQYSVRLKDLLRRGDMSANVDVKPGDVLVIPESWF
jgi:polysaccharide export outer membrane protein